MNELMMLFYNTPRMTHTFAMIRRVRPNQTDDYICAILSGDTKTSFLIEPRQTALLNFSNRRTTITPLIYSTDNGALVRHKNIRDVENVLPPAARTRVTLNKGKNGTYLYSEDVDTGWIASNGFSYLSNGGLITQDHNKENSPTSKFNSVYNIEMVPSTLMTINLHIDEIRFYFCSVFSAREFFVGIPVYVREEDSPKPPPPIKNLNAKMREWLESQDIAV